METFAKLFARFLVFVYHCFDRSSAIVSALVPEGPSPCPAPSPLVSRLHEIT
jgi:hypothetical protein